MSEPAVLFRVGPPDPAPPHLTAIDLAHLAAQWGVTPDEVAADLVDGGDYAPQPSNPAAVREPHLTHPPVDAAFEDLDLEASPVAPARGGA